MTLPSPARRPSMYRSSVPLLALVLVGCATRITPPPAVAAAPAVPRLLGTPVLPSGASLIIPVAGVTPEQLRDSYAEPRSGGRTHAAIDIMAPRRTPALAAADATVLKLHESRAGGHSLYLLDHDGRTRYYYAHLDAYAHGLREGQPVSAGEVVGYVGDTGNAAPGNYHLHFSVAILADPARWWEGRNLNPYPLLTTSAGSIRLGGR